MKQLFLCSYFAGVKNLFKQYASEKQLGKHVLFIPTAGNVEEYRGYIDEALQTFADLGFQVEILDISACDIETAQAKIFQSKLLYVSGGNTFYLLQELKKKQLLSLIKEQIADGMVYVGESAGAIITAKDIDKLLKTGKSTQSLTSGNADLTLDDIVDESFAQELFNQQPGTRKHPKLNGLQLINREVIIKYLHQLLRIDRRTAPLRVIGHEFPVKRPLTIKVNGLEKQIETGGRIDRLDEIYVDSDNARLRVVDYKTGSKVAESLKSVDEMFDPKFLNIKSDYTMQAMLYSLIEATNDMEHNPNHHAVSPALLFIQHAGSEDYTPVLSIDTEEITDVTVYEEDFLRKLTEILEEIHNPDIAFEPTSNPKDCGYCPYKQMCGR